MKKTSKIMQTFRSISVVDKFLLCFLLLFMAQMAYGLFTDRLLSPSTGTIDAVVRTFASAVFGYFLSGNTGKARTFSSARGVAASLPVGRGNAPKGAIGFTDGTGSETVPLSAQIADGGECRLPARRNRGRGRIDLTRFASCRQKCDARHGYDDRACNAA